MKQTINSSHNIMLLIKVKYTNNTRYQVISVCYIPAIDRLQELTCLHSKHCLLRAELFWQLVRFFFPLWTSFQLLWTALAIKSWAVLNGEDVFYEERRQRFDCVRHFHPVIHKSEASQCQRAAAAGDVVEAVCLLTHSHGLNLYESRGGFTATAPTSEGGGPTTASDYSTSTFTNFLFAFSDQPNGIFESKQ